MHREGRKHCLQDWKIVPSGGHQSFLWYKHIETVVNARRNNGRALNGRCRQQRQRKFTLDTQRRRRRDDWSSNKSIIIIDSKSSLSKAFSRARVSILLYSRHMSNAQVTFLVTALMVFVAVRTEHVNLFRANNSREEKVLRARKWTCRRSKTTT